MEPLNWAQGEYIALLADIAAGAVLDIPQAVCARYFACAPAAGPGQVQININVNPATQWGQYLYVTGDTETLGNWNANLGLPVDSAGFRLTGPHARNCRIQEIDASDRRVGRPCDRAFSLPEANLPLTTRSPYEP